MSKKLEEAAERWDSTDVEGWLELALSRVDLAWHWHAHEEQAGHRQRGIALAREALAHPRIEDYQVLKALLLRSLAHLEADETFLSYKFDIEPKRQGIALLEQALACAPDGSPVRFQVLVSLGNANRDYFRLAEEKTAFLEAAVPHYREAIRIAETAGTEVHLRMSGMGSTEADLARVRKCLADAHLLSGGQDQLEEARSLARQALGSRLKLRDNPRIAESYLTCAQIEWETFSRTRSPDSLKTGLEYVREGLALVTMEDARPVYHGLSALGLRLQHAMEEAGHSAGWERIGSSEVARIESELLHQTDPGSESTPKIPHEQRLEARENIVSGRFARSALLKSVVDATVEGLRRKRAGQSSDGTLRAEISQFELEWERGEQKRVAQRIVGVLIELIPLSQNSVLVEQTIRVRVLSLLERVFRADPLFPDCPWDLACLLLSQSAHVAISPLRLMTEKEASLGENWARRAIALLEKHSPGDAMMGEIYNTLALALYHNPGPGSDRRWLEALECHERLLALARKEEATHEEMNCLLNMGALLHDMGRQDPALMLRSIQVGEEAARLARQRGDTKTLIMSLSSVAFSRLCVMPHLQPLSARQAVVELKEAQQLALGEERFHHYLAQILNHLGIAYDQLFRFDGRNVANAQEARRCLIESAELHEQSGNHEEAARALHNLGELFLLTNQPSEALPIILQALQGRLGRPQECYETTVSLCRALERLPMPGLPEELADAIRDGLGEHLARVSRELFADGRWAQMLHTEKLRLELMARAGGLQCADVSSQLLAATNESLELAESAWSQAPTVDVKLHLSESVGEIYAFRALLSSVARSPASETLRIATRGKARTLLQHHLTRSRRFSPAEHNARHELEAKLRATERDPDVTAIPQEMRKSIELNKALSGSLLSQPAGQNLPEGIVDLDLETFEARLRACPNTAFIDLAASPFGTVGVITTVSSDGTVAWDSRCLELREGEILHWLWGSREDGGGVSDPSSWGWYGLLEAAGSVASVSDPEQRLNVLERCAEDMEAILLDVHRRLIGPVTAGLKARGVRHLVFAVQGAITQLPLAAACAIGPRGRFQYLIEEFESIRLTPSASAFARGTSTGLDTVERGVLLGVDEAHTLPAPERHLQGIESSWTRLGIRTTHLGSVFPGAARCTPDTALEALQSADVVHLLCHGLFDARELDKSGLLLEGGLLTVSRLIDSPRQIRPRLVVVSACQSFRTRPEDAGAEWLGMAGSMLRAGAQSAMAALWNVYYDSTVRLMDGFYAALEGHPVPQEALGVAMRSLLEEGRRLARAPSAMPHPLLDALDPTSRGRMARLLPAPLFWAGFEVLAMG